MWVSGGASSLPALTVILVHIVPIYCTSAVIWDFQVPNWGDLLIIIEIILGMVRVRVWWLVSRSVVGRKVDSWALGWGFCLGTLSTWQRARVAAVGYGTALQ